MKNKKRYGFSLAELMMTMLTISIALAAAAPTVTKMLSGGDIIWKNSTKLNEETQEFEQSPEEIYFEGPNVIVGAQRLPNLRNMKEYFKDAPDSSSFHFSPKTDKLVLFNSIANPANSNSFMVSSHLSFYNTDEENKAVYAGRLSADRYNLALGIGSLQSLVPNYENSDVLHRGQYNTAIGQYALLTNATGSYNTAFGYKALQGTPATYAKAGQHPSNSIALGDNALRNNVGKNNIAIGSYAGAHLEGDNNLVIGNAAGFKLKGNNNLLVNTTIGADYSENGTDKNNVKNLLIGHRSANAHPYINDDDNFSIGVLDYVTFSKNKSNYRPPVIQGFTKTQTCDGGTGCADGVLHAKGLIINTNRLNVKTSNGSKPIFAIDTFDHGSENKTEKSKYVTARGSEPSLVDISQATKRPCDGAPICLSQFGITTASYFTKVRKQGLFEQNPFNKEYVNQYMQRGTFPVFKTPTENNTYLPPNPTFDLYIGSVFKDDNEFRSENTVSLVGNNKNHSKYSSLLIDVGKAETNSGLEVARLQGSAKAEYQGSLPNVMSSKNALKIRTVKTAVNFLEDFKETSGSIDRLRDSLKYNIKCLFQGEGACNTNNIDKTNSTWERLKQGDCSLLSGAPLAQGLCCYASRRDEMTDCMNNRLPSDERLKNILGDNKAGLDEINKLKVVNYTYKADKTQTPHVGVIAQELKPVFPKAVKKGSDGYYRIRLEDMFYAMVNSVKELSVRKNDLETLDIDYIDASVEELQKENADIKAQNELIKQKNAEMEKRLSELETK